MNKRIILSLIILSALISFSVGFTVHATDYQLLSTNATSKIWGYFQPMTDSAGYYLADKTYGLQIAIASLVRTALTFMGTIFLILMIYGGFTWMTAAGSEEKVTKARGIIVNAIIGIVVVVAAYTITTYIIMNLINAVQGTNNI